MSRIAPGARSRPKMTMNGIQWIRCTVRPPAGIEYILSSRGKCQALEREYETPDTNGVVQMDFRFCVRSYRAVTFWSENIFQKH